jgi:hypothetical protein
MNTGHWQLCLKELLRKTQRMSRAERQTMLSKWFNLSLDSIEEARGSLSFAATT